MALPRKTIVKTILDNISPQPNGCWEWKGFINPGGYGMAGNRKGGSVLAHRLVFSEYIGMKIPSDRMVLHRCDNRKCCNPDHLYLGDQVDNMADMKDRKRLDYTTRKKAVAKRKLTEQDVRDIRSSYIPFVVTSVELAKKYNIDRCTVHKIITRRSWKHI